MREQPGKACTQHAAPSGEIIALQQGREVDLEVFGPLSRELHDINSYSSSWGQEHRHGSRGGIEDFIA